MKHLLKLADWSTEEITDALNLADKLKAERKAGIKHPILEGKSLGMIFTKASTRTRVSFEVGMYELGGFPLFLNQNDLQLNRGEPIPDTARVLSRFLDGIMIRTYKQSDVEGLAEYGSIPVINGLTDYCHPTQVLADLMTIREYKGELKGKKLTFIGDGNNMANSLIVGAIKTGMQISLACPAGFYPDPKIVKWAKENGDIFITSKIKQAIEDADVVYTDVWASMGQEKDADMRKIAFNGYQVNEENMKLAKPDAIVLHCLPAHREEEITAETFEKHAGSIFDEAENRLHAHKAILCECLR